MEEINKICCTGAERTPLQLRVDELSRQQLQESQSTVKKLTVQIQGLQDKVNSLFDSGYYHHLETGNSSELTLVTVVL